STNRCLEFPALYYRYIHTDYITAEQNVAMLKWLWQEAEYLYNGAGILYRGATAQPLNEEIAHNNRGAWHVYGFLNTVGNFPEFAKADQWTKLIEERLVDNINILLQPDGSYDEPTFSYPISVMNFFIQIGNLYKTLDIEPPEDYYEKLRKFGRYLMDCMYPTGQTPWWGDGRGSPKGIVSSLLSYVEDEELSYMVGKGGSYPAQHHSLYKDAKVATDRTSWDSPSSVIFMNARNGGSHSHRDSLAFTWYHQDRELLTDTGVSSYDSKHPHFYWQRNRSISHNTVEVDGTGQTASGDSDIDITANDGTSVITAWTDANIDVRHYRNVSYIKPLGLILVNDRLTPADSNTHTYTQNWHTPPLPTPATTIESSGGKQGKTHYVTGSNLIVAPVDPDKLTATLENGYDANGAVSTKFMSYKQETAGAATFDTALYAVSEGAQASVSTTAIQPDTTDDTASAMNIDITRDGKAYHMTYYNSFEHNGDMYSFGNYTANGSQAGVCTDDSGDIVYASVTGGDKIYADGNIIVQTDAQYSDITLYADGSTLNIYSSADIANSELVVTGFTPYITTAVINGKKVNVEKKSDKIYVNSEFNYISDSSGSFTGSNGETLYWNYYGDKKILQFDGEGEIGDYSGKTTPWSQYAADATALWISPGVTGVTKSTLAGIDGITQVYMDEKYFDTSWKTTDTGRYNSDGISIITDETYTLDNLPPDYADGKHTVDNDKYQYGPDTWAERVLTIKDEYNFDPTMKYTAASGTDSIVYQPVEIQENNAPKYYYCNASGTYSWSVNPAEGTLTLDTPNGSMKADQVRSGKFYPWYGMADKITSIYFNDNVTKLSKHHFDGLANVKSIRFSPNMYLFGAYAFTNCTGLETITIPGNIGTISSKTFMGCINLKEVIILPGSNQVSISYDAFSGCTNLKTLVLPSNVVNIAGSKDNWANAKKLTSNIESCSIYAAQGSAGQQYAEAMGSNYIELNQLADNSGIVADTGVQWSYTADTNTIVFDGEGTIPALHNHPDTFEQNMWKAYCGANSTIRLGIGVGMEKNAFQGVAQAKAIYCKLDDCTFTYKKNADLTFPASFTLDDGREICSANGLIASSTFKKGYFDCETTATAYPYYGYYDSYDSATSWDDINNSLNTAYVGTVYYEYNFDTQQLTVTPVAAPDISGKVSIGNTSILNRMAYPWNFAGINTMAKELIFEPVDGLTICTIGKSAFMEFTQITGLIIPYGVETIGMRAFKSCTSLEKISVPGSASLAGGYIFANCGNVKEFVVGFGASVGSSSFTNESSTDKAFATDTITCYAGSILPTTEFPKYKNG
ncbi:MAG: leucine-rich repeat protein, partial [Clostridia bacterium]|nr:leucine-rich repeat protein [Clostridia bacterium]